MYTIDPTTGALTSIGSVDAGAYPTSVAVDPSGNFAYATISVGPDRPGTVSMYSINSPAGTLTSLGTVPTGVNPWSLVVDRSDRFAYVANNAFFDFIDGSVSMYALDATSGLLTPGGVIDVGIWPFSMAVDPSSSFAYLAATSDFIPSLYVNTYTIDAATGALSFTQMVGAGAIATSVTVDPSGSFVYVTDSGFSPDINGAVWMYTIDPTTGALTSIGSVDTGTAYPQSVAVAPSGSFAYVANCVESSIGSCWYGGRLSTALGFVSIYSIDAATGSLTSIGTIAAGAFPSAIAIDPSGNFAYVTNFVSNSVSMYSIDSVTGALTLIGTIGT
jgi:DNA-binding beta-propeller fold protein YncE